MVGRKSKDPLLIGPVEPKVLEQIAQVATDPDEKCPNCSHPITLTVAQTGAVLAARDAIVGGAPPGAVLKGPNGEIAHRVNDKGVHVWRVSCIDGTEYNDTQPTLEGWTPLA